MARRVFVRAYDEVLKPCGLYSDELTALSTYNAEKHRGLMHDPDYAAQMAELQARFDAAMRADPCRA